MTRVRKSVQVYCELEVCPKCGETMDRDVYKDVDRSIYPLHYAWKCPYCETEIWTANNGEVQFDWKY